MLLGIGILPIGCDRRGGLFGYRWMLCLGTGEPERWEGMGKSTWANRMGCVCGAYSGVVAAWNLHEYGTCGTLIRHNTR